MSVKRMTLNLTVASIAFVIGVIGSRVNSLAPHHVAAVAPSVPLCDMSNDLNQVLDVQYCDLLANPNRYDGRIVRFEAVMLAQSGYEPMWDHVSLGKPECERELWANDQFHLTSRTCPDVMKKLDSLLMRDDPSYPRKNAKVRIVGKFFSPKWTVLPNGQDQYESERFTIISVERAASIDDDN
jgi:hypothetical protein